MNYFLKYFWRTSGLIAADDAICWLLVYLPECPQILCVDDIWDLCGEKGEVPEMFRHSHKEVFKLSGDHCLR